MQKLRGLLNQGESTVLGTRWIAVNELEFKRFGLYPQGEGGLWAGTCPQGALRVQLGLRPRLGWPLLPVELTVSSLPSPLASRVGAL